MRPADPQLLNRELFDALIERARRSPRLRVNHNFHTGPEDNPHRFLNVMVRGTYIAPHRHSTPPKAESFLVIEGQLAFFTFDDAGAVATVSRLGRDPVGIDLQPRTWHTIAPLSDCVVCYEVKPGPYDPGSDKEFAPWAPREGDPSVAAYLEYLMAVAKSRG